MLHLTEISVKIMIFNIVDTWHDGIWAKCNAVKMEGVDECRQGSLMDYEVCNHLHCYVINPVLECWIHFGESHRDQY